VTEVSYRRVLGRPGEDRMVLEILEAQNRRIVVGPVAEVDSLAVDDQSHGVLGVVARMELVRYASWMPREVIRNLGVL